MEKETRETRERDRESEGERGERDEVSIKAQRLREIRRGVECE